MDKKSQITLLLLIVCFNLFSQIKTIPVNTFSKVIVSPHIEITFKEGPEEKVIIEKNTVSFDKLNIKVRNKKLYLYLDGARRLPKRKGVYKKNVIKAIVVYKKLAGVTLRGNEIFKFKNNVQSKYFKLAVYGESKVYIDKLNLEKLKVSMYGNSFLEIKSGTIKNQKISSYGNSEINLYQVENKETSISAFGRGSVKCKVEDLLKITAFGNTTITYKGNPVVKKRIEIGDNRIEKL